MNTESWSSADFSIEEFLDDKFDAADHLNRNLPSLDISDGSSTESTSAALANVSAKTQALVLQLNAQSSRISSSLTKVTDEIIRSGGRLAYEVEILKGDAAGLTETLDRDLREPIGKIIHGGGSIEEKTAQLPEAGEQGKEGDGEGGRGGGGGKEDHRRAFANVDRASNQPKFISELRTLIYVRERVQSVIEVFGKAMEWVLPPSEYSLTSSIISVSAPEPGNSNESMEEKGRAYMKNVQTEIRTLADAAEGMEELKPAKARVEELRELSLVWKGTSEEKARTRFVDSLKKVIEDKENVFQRRGRQQRKEKHINEDSLKRSNSQLSRQNTETKYGFLGNLQRMRDGLYLE